MQCAAVHLARAFERTHFYDDHYVAITGSDVYLTPGYRQGAAGS